MSIEVEELEVEEGRRWNMGDGKDGMNGTLYYGIE